MTCGILCPGPSLERFLKRPVAYDLTIGVNRAAAAYPCDVWAFGDAVVFTSYAPKGRPRILTNDYALGRLRAHRDDLARYELIMLQQIRLPEARGYDETTYTVLTAIAYALDQRVRTIVLHGCDLEGVADWDGGASLGPNRTVERWVHEARRIDELAGVAGRRGVTLVRAATGEEVAGA